MKKFYEQQKNACKFIENMIKKNRLSHAYIIESNKYDNKNEFAYSFAKILSNNSLDIEIIKPDGLWIKKEQIENLQRDFSTKSLVGNNKIYIIEEADKMNLSASNTLLKFLEEPEENIAAILVVDNLYQVLETIKSRCQIITLVNNKTHDDYENTSENIIDYIKFLENIEKRKKDVILYENKMFLNRYKNKDDIIEFLNFALDFYKLILDTKLDKKVKKIDNFKNEILMISQLNTLKSICEKINIINEKKEHIKYNENLNLLIDDFIIKLSEVNYEEGSGSKI